MTDLGANRRAELVPREYELLDLAHDAILVMDLDRVIAFWNQSAEELYGWSRAEAVGQRAHELLGTRFPVPFDEVRASLDETGLWEGQLVRTTRGGQEIAVASRWALHRSTDGQPDAILAIDRDVSERQQHEVARAHLAAIVESSDDAIISKTLDGVITSWNAGAERLYGYGREEVVGKPISVIVPEDRPDELPGILARLKQGEHIEHYETERVRKDGLRIDVSLSVSPIKDTSGTIIGAASIARDITRRKRIEQGLRESEARFRALAEAIPEFIWSARPDGVTDYRNPQFLEYLGKSSQEIDGLNWVATIHPDDRERAMQARTRAFSTGSDYAIEVRIRRASDGAYRWFLSKAIPACDDEGNVVRWYGIVADIHERKQAEDERAALLSRERAAREQAEAAVRLRDEFLSVASHELRTPLATLQAHAQLMLRQVWKGAELDETRVERSLGAITRQSEKLGRLIGQLLDISRIQAGKLTLEPQLIDVGELIENATAAMRARTDQHLISVQAPGPMQAMVDPLRLEQVLTNLLDNAIKYSPEGGTIEASVGKLSNGKIEIVVRDHGSGIPPAQRSQIFERFYQAHGNSYSSGMGLGLYISRQIVELHDGTIRAEFPDDGGARFVIELPGASG